MNYFHCHIYLVDSPEGRHVHRLPSDSTSTANTSGVLAGAGVDDGVDQNLQGVLASQQVDDLEAVLDNSHGQKLLSVVSAVHHQAEHEDCEIHDGVQQPVTC